MLGYDISNAIISAYEKYKNRLIECRDKEMPAKAALCRAIIDDIIEAGKGKFPRNAIKQIVETDVLLGKIHFGDIPKAVKSAPVVEIKEEVKEKEYPNAGDFYHCGDIGDIIFALPAIKYLGGGSLYLGYDPMALEPVKPNAPRGRITEDVFNFIKPLLEVQPYIKNVVKSNVYDRRWVNINLFRKRFIDGGFHLNLAIEQAKAIGADPESVNEQWLTVPDGKDTADVVIARSPRYHNNDFPWKDIVDKYKKVAVFVGLPVEHSVFCSQFGKIPFYPTSNALELAQIIKSCKLFIGNASSPQAIAEGFKKKSVIERFNKYVHAYFPRKNSIYFDNGTLEIDFVPKKRKFYHVVSRYNPRDADSIRRINFAQASWELMYGKGVRPIHIWTYRRDSRELGDKRGVPYLKDLLEEAIVGKNEDDVVFFTNDDIILLPEFFDELQSFMMTREACTVFRKDLLQKPATLSDITDDKLRNSQGRDMFAFTVRWLKKHLANFPDYVIGTTDWDYFLAVYLRITEGIKVNMANIGITNNRVEMNPGLVIHEYHDAYGQRPGLKFHTPESAYNHNLTLKFFKDYNLYHMR